MPGKQTKSEVSFSHSDGEKPKTNPDWKPCYHMDKL